MPILDEIRTATGLDARQVREVIAEANAGLIPPSARLVERDSARWVEWRSGAVKHRILVGGVTRWRDSQPTRGTKLFIDGAPAAALRPASRTTATPTKGKTPAAVKVGHSVKKVIFSLTAWRQLDPGYLFGSGLEHGAGLLGERDGDTVWIDSALPATVPGSSYADAMRFDVAKIREYASLWNKTWIGCGHSHPTERAKALPRPSRADLRSWHGSLELAGYGTYAGLIFTKGADQSWTAPHAWATVLNRGSDGRLTADYCPVYREAETGELVRLSAEINDNETPKWRL